MNRAEKRRQQKLAKKAGKSTPTQQYSRAVQDAIDLAVQHHNAGDLAKAENLYQQVLQTEPDQPVALHLLGVIAHQVGKNEIAVELIGKALASKPDYLEAHYDLGNVFKEQGSFDSAITSFRKALAIKPDLVEAHINLGNALESQGKLDDAVASYRKALAFQPGLVEAHFNIGNAYKKQGKLPEAVTSFQKALGIDPEDYEVLTNLGNALRAQKKVGESVDCFRKALAIKPDLIEAHSNLAVALNMCGQRSEALAHFNAGLEIKRGQKAQNLLDRSFRLTTKAKMTHDIEQLDYLVSLGDETEKFRSLSAAYKTVKSEVIWPNEDDTQVLLSDSQLQRLGNSHNRPFHRLDGSEVKGMTLSDDLDVEKITADYFAHEFGMTFFDNLLNQNTLASLRRYLLESTIWFDCRYKGGYLGAMLDDGLACPLLLQISDDLRHTFPDIFKDHKLQQLWGYKYDSRLRGIKTHADFAAVNVNFWITPDDANLNPESGGLVVHNVEAPLDWDFKSYNADENLISEFLADHDNGKVVVPYRQNRIVLFNSDLFHATDTIEFKPGYENRRINVTMLFGDRGD